MELIDKNLKQDVKEMITNAKPYNPTIDNGIFYCKGRKDMKQEILEILEEHKEDNLDLYNTMVTNKVQSRAIYLELDFIIGKIKELK